jgi:hypothetical protein
MRFSINAIRFPITHKLIFSERRYHGNFHWIQSRHLNCFCPQGHLPCYLFAFIICKHDLGWVSLYLRPITYYLLPITYYSLLTIHHSLPIIFIRINPLKPQPGIHCQGRMVIPLHLQVPVSRAALDAPIRQRPHHQTPVALAPPC